MNLEDTRAQYLTGALDKHEYIERMHRLHATFLEYPHFIRGSDVARIEITECGVVLETRDAGIRMQIDAADERLTPVEILNFGSYEPEETAMFLRLAAGAKVMFDIGSNIGWYSLNTAKKYGPSVQVHAFEPIPATYAQLTANIALNGAESIQAHRFGFSDEACDKTFYYFPQGSGQASSADLSKRPDVEAIVCTVRTLDDYVAETGIAPEIIKCDVEGAELFVFRGGEATLSEAHPIVFTEMLRKWAKEFGYHPNDIIDLFRGHGYSCFTVHGDRLRRFDRVDDETAETNYFFLHETGHATQIAELVDRR